MWRCLSYLSGEGAAASHDIRARGRVGARGQASTPGRAAGEVLPDPHRPQLHFIPTRAVFITFLCIFNSFCIIVHFKRLGSRHIQKEMR